MPSHSYSLRPALIHVKQFGLLNVWNAFHLIIWCTWSGVSSASQSRVRGDHPRSHEWRSVIFRHEASTKKKLISQLNVAFTFILVLFILCAFRCHEKLCMCIVWRWELRRNAFSAEGKMENFPWSLFLALALWNWIANLFSSTYAWH